jgi:hypothetical protein
MKRDFTYFTNVVLEAFGASNNLIVTWQGTQSSLIKLIINMNVSKPILDIERSNVAMLVTHCAMVGNTCIFITLAIIFGIVLKQIVCAKEI